jgi:glycerol-3-phosphate dehydrogenase
MIVYLAKSFRKRVTKKTPWVYYFLRDTRWDPKTKKRRNIYLAYVGVRPVLSEKKARQIARKLGVSLDDLRRVRGLKILED